MNEITFGPNKVKYNLYSIEEIRRAGYVFNAHNHPSHLFTFCVPCNRYAYSSAYTPSNENWTGRSIYVCEQCNQAAIRPDKAHLDFYFNLITSLADKVIK